MRINEHIALATPHLLLVPYSAHHVPLYHEWMQDESLQQATASEPLSLAEEHAMQQSWRHDGDKLTWIICTPTSTGATEVKAQTDDGAEQMVGDVNLFIVEDDSDSASTDGRDGDDGHGDGTALVGELEIMIARKEMQRRGYGRRALLGFMWYVLANMAAITDEYSASINHDSSKGSTTKKRTGLDYFRVKIGSGNERSIALFEGLGFRRVKDEPNYFGELELRRAIRESTEAELREDKAFEMPRILPYTGL